jgi:putative ABC transport system permease protein
MRARQFAVATIGATLVFAMTLVMAGLSGGFRAETRKTVEGIGGDGFIVPAGSGGPFTTLAVMPSSTVEVVRNVPGVTAAAPLVIFPKLFIRRGGVTYGEVIAGPASGLGAPPVRGLAPLHHGEAVVDDLTKVKIGQEFTIGNVQFHAVHRVHGYSYLGGLPNVYVSLADARALGFEGRDVATAVAFSGHPRSLPSNLLAYTNKQARDDVIHRLSNGLKSIDVLQYLLGIVAAVIIGAVVYLSSLERLRDFAVLKAIGSSSRRLYAGLAAQAVLVSLLAAGMAIVVSPLLARLVPMPLAIPSLAYILLPAVAVIVGLLSSLSGLRQAVRVDPALAFAGG